MHNYTGQITPIDSNLVRKILLARLAILPDGASSNELIDYVREKYPSSDVASVALQLTTIMELTMLCATGLIINTLLAPGDRRYALADDACPSDLATWRSRAEKLDGEIQRMKQVLGQQQAGPVSSI